MGLTNISHKEVVKSIANFQNDLLKNPYYLFNDQKAHIVDYLNLNTKKSTLDQALKIPYSNLGINSPLRFNYIHNFYLYGLSRIATNLEMGDFGLESSEVTGEALVLPNTITPYPGDYFIISFINKKKSFLFKVTASTMDTMDDGGNFWKIEYRLESGEDGKRIKNLVDDEDHFEFHTGTVGSNFASIIRKSSWDLAKGLDDAAVMLKQFYLSLFYNKFVQTITCINLYQHSPLNLHSSYFYDPYLVEFIRSNKILSNNGGEYVYMGHKTTLDPSFPFRYAKSIWRIIEQKDINNIGACTILTYAKYIDDPATIFQTRYENYFELVYKFGMTVLDENITPPIQILDQQVVGHVIENQLFDYDSNYAKYNILIKYMNNEQLIAEDLKIFERMQECENNLENFFYVPMAIFCIESYIRGLLTETSY